MERTRKRISQGITEQEEENRRRVTSMCAGMRVPEKDLTKLPLGLGHLGSGLHTISVALRCPPWPLINLYCTAFSRNVRGQIWGVLPRFPESRHMPARHMVNRYLLNEQMNSATHFLWIIISVESCSLRAPDMTGKVPQTYCRWIFHINWIELKKNLVGLEFRISSKPWMWGDLHM